MVPHLIIQVCHTFLCCALEEFIVFLEVLPKPYKLPHYLDLIPVALSFIKMFKKSMFLWSQKPDLR